jgi:hypothetical protein
MPDELTTVATFETPLQAAIARNYLESEGVTAFLADDETVSMAWHLTNAIGGVKLRVATDQAEKAIQLLDRLEQDRAAKDAGGDEAVDEAGEEDFQGLDEEDEEPPLSTADELAGRAFRAALLGLIFCPLQLYSMWLLASLVIWRESPSPKMRVLAIVAAILDLWLVVVCYMLFWR